VVFADNDAFVSACSDINMEIPVHRRNLRRGFRNQSLLREDSRFLVRVSSAFTCDFYDEIHRYWVYLLFKLI
jgi:hypothetical protein